VTDDPRLQAILGSYVPRMSAPAGRPAVPVTGAVLFADISGFTALTEALATRPDGLEELCALLDQQFDALIERVTAHGGDVVKFAGDALLAVWPAADDGGDLDAAILRAAACALAVQAAPANDDIALRIAIAGGELSLMAVGGERSRWEQLLLGEPLEAVRAAAAIAGPGETIVASSAWDRVASRCLGTPIDGGARLLGIHDPVPVRAAPDREIGPEAWSFVPGAIRSRLEAGQSGWLAELRLVSVLFVNLPDLGEDPQPANGMRALQRALYRHEGSVNKLSVDDKGVTLVAALGLPPLAHEDDPARAVSAALAMKSALAELGLGCSIGIATGRAFCGTIGNSRRREYTLVGDVVNLAARLMQHADGDVRTDAATAQACRDRGFEALPAVKLKGKRDPVPVFRPEAGPRPASEATLPLVGRKAERQLLADAAATAADGGFACVVVEGEPGIGKSRLIEDFATVASGKGLRVLVAAADAVERTAPWHAWRAVVAEFLFGEASGDERRARALTMLGPDRKLAPLVRDIVPLDVDDDDETRAITGSVRADNLRGLVVRLLCRAALERPLAILVEDGHWLDSASADLVRAIAADVRPAVLVVATRPSPEVLALLQAQETRRIVLQALPQADALAMVRARLGVRALPPALEAFIRDRGEGQPLFCEEIALALRDSGALVIEDRKCRVVGDLAALDFPDTLQGVITSRIDRLSPSEQLTLKVASVIGRTFSSRVLSEVHPLTREYAALEADLAALERFDLTPRSDVPLGPGRWFTFKHVLTQEVAYNLMLFAQRRELHRAVATWYERSPLKSASYALLANHWREAGERTRAIEYLSLAGEQAVRGGAWEEAAKFLGEALALDSRPTVELSERAEQIRRGRWHRQLADALYGLGRIHEAYAHAERALEALGAPLPHGRAAIGLAIARQVAIQATHVVRPSPSPEAGWDAEVSRTDALIGLFSVWMSTPLIGVHCALRSLNHADRVGPSRELAVASANIAMAAGFVPLRRVAARYERQALAIAEGLRDPHAQAHVLFTCGLYELGRCAWEPAATMMARSRELSLSIGDLRQATFTLASTANASQARGRYDEAIAIAGQVAAEAARSGNHLHRLWGLYLRAEACMRLGRVAEAALLLEQVQTLLDDSPSMHISRLRSGGVLAHVRLLQDRRAEATELADRIAASLAGTRPTVPSALEGYAGVAEVHLADAKRDRSKLEKARQSVAIVALFARMFPLGEARARRLEAALAAIEGRTRRARARNLAAADAGARNGTPLDEGLARIALGDAAGPRLLAAIGVPT
jgi:class 3 adenylate cyclase/tetratricopeptide (TPR) repeat protein